MTKKLVVKYGCVGFLLLFFSFFFLLLLSTQRILFSFDSKNEMKEKRRKKNTHWIVCAVSEGGKYFNFKLQAHTTNIHILTTDYINRIQHFDELWNYIAVNLCGFDDIHMPHVESNRFICLGPVFCAMNECFYVCVVHNNKHVEIQKKWTNEIFDRNIEVLISLSQT